MIAWDQITEITRAVGRLNLTPDQARRVAYFARISLRNGDDDDIELAVFKAFERICGEWRGGDGQTG